MTRLGIPYLKAYLCLFMAFKCFYSQVLNTSDIVEPENYTIIDTTTTEYELLFNESVLFNIDTFLDSQDTNETVVYVPAHALPTEETYIYDVNITTLSHTEYYVSDVNTETSNSESDLESIRIFNQVATIKSDLEDSVTSTSITSEVLSVSAFKQSVNETSLLQPTEMAPNLIRSNCTVLIPDALTHRVNVTFVTDKNDTDMDTISYMFSQYLHEVFNDSRCNSVVQTSFHKWNSMFSYCWTNMSNLDNCNHLAGLQSQMIDKFQTSVDFLNQFLPNFQLVSIHVTKLGKCATLQKAQNSVTILLVVCALCLFPCLFLIMIKILHLHVNTVTISKKPRNMLRSRQPIVFNAEVGIYVPTTNGEPTGMDNEAFCSKEI